MKYILTALLGISLLACKKFDEKLEIKNNDSGVISVTLKGGRGNAAKIGEEIVVFAKIGKKDAALQFYIGNIPVAPQSRESRMVRTATYGATGDSVMLPMEVFTFKIPNDAPLGYNNFYFTADGEKRPPVTLIVSKPDILYPGKVIVSPFAVAPELEELIDGPLGTAGIYRVQDIAFDRNTQNLYILESFPDYANGGNAIFVVRKVKDNIITTIAGGGKDPDATIGRQRDFGQVSTMVLGPDGMLYLGTTTHVYVPYIYGDKIGLPRPEILKLDPATGQVSHVAGGKSKNGNSYAGIKDGKEEALLANPLSLAFDKNGDLYFLDDGVMLRKVATDGAVSSLFGAFSTYEYEGEDVSTGEPLRETVYEPIMEHTDGFGDEVRFSYAMKLVMAGNGKLYVQEGPYGNEFNENIREVNPETKEVSTIIGKPKGVRTYTYSGTFKEVELYSVMSFDVDFDGNIIFSNMLPDVQGMIYKMDLIAETVTFIAGGGPRDPESTHSPQPGNKAAFVSPKRIVFDQFGTLYVTDGMGTPVKQINIER
ncbi:hypothetical protein [Chitinophaga sp. YIM B06452]|uniref:hypothetical protein n=1 Tax=Chitinophaga sp. YIM B06452 TaxID=3082158 RepID=UPI0031FEC70E